MGLFPMQRSDSLMFAGGAWPLRLKLKGGGSDSKKRQKASSNMHIASCNTMYMVVAKGGMSARGHLKIILAVL
jgi:hypothetical protein